MFFDVCDGMFLNYCWKDKNLKSSKGLAVDAGRPYDVYVGIDVFGRGCLGDGGFNTCEVYDLGHIMRKPVYAICEQQRRRSACRFTQSDQHLCCSMLR